MFTTLLRLPSSSAQQCHYSASLSLADQTRRGIVFFPVWSADLSYWVFSRSYVAHFLFVSSVLRPSTTLAQHTRPRSCQTRLSPPRWTSASPHIPKCFSNPTQLTCPLTYAMLPRRRLKTCPSRRSSLSSLICHIGVIWVLPRAVIWCCLRDNVLRLFWGHHQSRPYRMRLIRHLRRLKYSAFRMKVSLWTQHYLIHVDPGASGLVLGTSKLRPLDDPMITKELMHELLTVCDFAYAVAFSDSMCICYRIQFNTGIAGFADRHIRDRGRKLSTAVRWRSSCSFLSQLVCAWHYSMSGGLNKFNVYRRCSGCKSNVQSSRVHWGDEKLVCTASPYLHRLRLIKELCWRDYRYVVVLQSDYGQEETHRFQGVMDSRFSLCAVCPHSFGIHIRSKWSFFNLWIELYAI